MAGGPISEANIYGLTIRESATDGSDFTNPDADYRRLFLGEDGLLHVKDSAGAVTSPYSPARHGCLVYYGGATVGVNNTFVPFNTEIYDSDGYHESVTNPSRITIPAGLGGLYLLEYGFYAASAAAGEVARIQRTVAGPTSTNISNNVGETDDDFFYGLCVYPLDAGDFVEVFFYGNRTLGHASAYERQPHFSATLLGT